MNWRKVIQKRLRSESGDVVADVNAVVAGNVGKSGEVSTASSKQTVSVNSRSQARADSRDTDRQSKREGE